MSAPIGGTGALRHLLARLAARAELTETESRDAFAIVMSGAASDMEIAAFLMALRVRGETASELAGAVQAMRAVMLRIAAPPGTIDLCGTGGDGHATLNISTAAAIAAAACGATVAKHGNRAVSSASGATDVIAALGLDPDPDPAHQETTLRHNGLAFLHAPRHHPALRHAAAARRAIGSRSILNLAGPLCNPAGARRHLIGVYDRRWLRPMAEALAALDTERAWLVHGDGLDEITLAGETEIVALENGRIRHFTLTPEDAGLPRAPITAIAGGDPAFNARALSALLAGEPGPYRDIVALNAGAALVIAGLATSVAEGVHQAGEAIKSGAAFAKLASARGVAPRTPSKARL